MFTRVPMTDNRQTVFMGVPIEDRQAGDHRLAIFTGVAKTDNKQFLWKYRRQKKKKKKRTLSADSVPGSARDRRQTVFTEIPKTDKPLTTD